MDVDWQDPRVLALAEQLARTAQTQYEDSLTASFRVADSEYLGHRIAGDLLSSATSLEFGDAGAVLTFAEGEVRP